MSNIKKDIRFRVYVAFTCVCLFGVAILVKAAMVQTKEGPQLRALGREMRTHTATLPAERGNIYTEDGRLLCSTIPQFDLRVDFSVIDQDTFYKQVRPLSQALAGLFKDGTAAYYEQRLTAAYRGKEKYHLLKKNLAYYQYQSVREFPIFNKGKARGGLIVETKTKRINPYGMLAYRTIGLFRDNVKTIGLEGTFDSILHGENGTRVDQKATGGVWMPVPGSEVEPQNGKDIVTTLDISIQGVAEHALMTILRQYECLYGTVVVMEVQTGKIRALVNLGRQKDGTYWEDFNYAMQATEPGSTFKLATLTALLRDDKINVENNVNCYGGQRQFFDRTMHDSHHGLGTMPIKNAFAQSSNVAMASLAQQYYGDNPKKYIAHLKFLHLNAKTGIDLAGERITRLIEPGTEHWRKTTLPWMATGYGILVSPLHTCMLYNAVANNGKMMKPYLISSVREYGKDIQTFGPKALVEKIADDDDIAQLKKCTEEVVLTGTGKHIKSPFYSIAGKTGTAQVYDKGIPYSAGVYQGSFVGYFPADKPRYTMIVVIRTKPHAGSYYGGTLAAPVFNMIADKIFATGLGQWNGPLDSIAKANNSGFSSRIAATGKNYDVLLRALNHRPAGEVSPTAIASLHLDSSKNVHLRAKEIFHGVVPDVKGLGLKDAIYMLENEGLKVIVRGRGTIQGQSITPGARIVKGQNITLLLS